ncbi:sulfurtransferase [cyanobiont of Ornithocercus magnificus]|nr:sulfurtransferase [cyanobiont of Ornithocercus magnificus]
MLIDVRELAELDLARLPFEFLHLPLSKSSYWVPSLPDLLTVQHPVVVLCHAGVRSWQFGSWLLAQNWGVEVWNLEGGIDAWSVDVDPAVPRY